MHIVPITQLPNDLNPPPPQGANFAVICRTSCTDLETARRLFVSLVRRDGIVTKTYSRTYMLDADSHQTDGTSLDWFAFVALAIYLIALEHRFGATVGKHLLGLRVAETLDAQRVGVSLRRAVVRNVMIWLGVLPMMIVAFGDFVLSRGDTEAFWTGGFFAWFMAAGLLGMVWYLWVAIQVARKRDQSTIGSPARKRCCAVRLGPRRGTSTPPAFGFAGSDPPLQGRVKRSNLLAEQVVDRVAAAAAEEDRGAQQQPQHGVFDALVGPEVAELPVEHRDDDLAISIRAAPPRARVNSPNARQIAAT